MKTAGDLNANPGAFNGLWMVGVAGDTLCMHQACPNCRGGWTTAAERDACPARVNKRAVMDRAADSKGPGGPPRPLGTPSRTPWGLCK
jgi:hypothetical protein